MGYLVERVKGNSKWQKSVDFFGLWDIIAVKSDEVVWIQVTTNRLKPPAERAAMAAFPAPGRKLLYIWYDRQKDPRVIDLLKPTSLKSRSTSSGETRPSRKSLTSTKTCVSLKTAPKNKRP